MAARRVLKRRVGLRRLRRCPTGTARTAPRRAANAGLDLEMPGPPQWFGAKLADAVRDGEVDEKRLDDMVRRVLTILDRSGALDSPIRSRSCPRSPSTTRSTATSPGAPPPGASCCCRTAPPPLPLDRRAHARGRRPERRHRARDGRRQRARADASARCRRSSACAPGSVPTSRSCTSAGARTTRSRRCSTLASSTARSRSRTTRAASAPASRCSSRTSNARLLHVDGSGRRRRARRLLGPVARTARPAGVRRVEVQLVQAGRARCPARRRGVARQLEPDGTGRGLLRDGQRRAGAVRRSRGGPPLRARRRGDPRRARAGRPVGRARAAGGRRPDRSGGDGGARAPTRSCASSAPTASGRPRATTASR